MDLDVPPDMVITFHKLACDAHNLQIENDDCTPKDNKTECLVGHKNAQLSHSATPTLLLVKDADHYNILNAASAAWLELFANIEKYLIE